MAQSGLDLPYGFKDARVVLLTQAIIGEFFQGMPLPVRGPALHHALGCCSPFDVVYCIHRCTGTAGGLIFGWNALAIMLKDQGNYNANCPPGDWSHPLKSRCEMPDAAVSRRHRCVARVQALLQSHHQVICCADLNTRCAWQESHLAVLWTIGVFALNFGPVVVGPILDYVGPKLTAMFGRHAHAQP